jgi:hypothetical protein
MCPMCIATLTWIVVGTISTGGISALTGIKLRGKTRKRTTNQRQGEREEQRHENTTNRPAA